MLINPLLSQTIRRSRKLLLDYKNSPAGKADLRPEDVSYYVGQKFTNEQKKNFYSRPKELQFLSLKDSKLNLLLNRHTKLLNSQNKIKSEFAKSNGQKVIFTTSGNQNLLHFKNEKIKKQFGVSV